MDADGDGFASPGDTLLYQVRVTNTGNQDATGVTLTDSPDTNTSIVAGSVATSRGTVLDGNGGAPPITVDFGTLAGGGDSVTVSFNVTINDPLPADVTRVVQPGQCQQRRVADGADRRSAVAGSDRPDRDQRHGRYPACSRRRPPAGGGPDNDGAACHRATPCSIRVTITNSRQHGQHQHVFSDILDANTPLVVGSVQTSAGTVTTGNTAGDTSVAVDVGTIPGSGASVSDHLPGHHQRPAADAA